MVTIKISVAAYHEIASVLEKAGRKLGQNVGTLTIEKDDTIINPIDWKLVTVRKDCIVEAVKSGEGDIVFNADKIFKYIMEGKIEEKKEIKPKGNPQKAANIKSENWK